METGKVKFYNQEKGYGFITPDSGKKDIFFHITAVKNSEVLSAEDQVEFELTSNQKGICATNIRKK